MFRMIALIPRIAYHIREALLRYLVILAGQPILAEPLLIAENVWIVRGYAIPSGVSIGHGAVIGANSAVSRDLYANGINAGAPGKLIQMRTVA